MSLGEEDLGVLMKIFVENIGEGSKEHSMDVKRQLAQGTFSLNAWRQTETHNVFYVPCINTGNIYSHRLVLPLTMCPHLVNILNALVIVIHL